MSYPFEWLVPSRVLHMRVVGETGSAEIKAINELMMTELERAAQPLHMLADIEQMRLVLFDLPTIYSLTPFLRHPLLGWWMIYGSENVMYYYAGRTAAHITGARFHLTKTLPDALALLARLDPTLPPLSADLVSAATR